MAAKKIGDGRTGPINFDLSDVALFDVKILKTLWWDSNGQTVAGFDNFSKYHLKIEKIMGVTQK